MATYNPAVRPNVYTTPGAPSTLPMTATVNTKPLTLDSQSSLTPADPMFGGSAPLPMTAPNRPVGSMGDIQNQIQRNLPFTPNNGNPQGANNMPSRPQFNQQPTPERRAYLNNVSGQQSDLGRYRPPTLAGNGNDPMNWNDYGGYDYNLPSAYGPTPNSPYSRGPYGGYPSYLQPNWMQGAGSAPLPNSAGMRFPGGG